MYLEVKGRPPYLVMERLEHPAADADGHRPKDDTLP
jgi:hypothetical protein